MFQVNQLIYKDIINISSLNIKKNTSTAIMGSSGSGKTTFLKLLDRLFHKDSGEIFYNNKSIYNIVNYRRIVTMVPQQPVVFEGDVYENLKIAFDFCGKQVLDKNQLLEILKVACFDIPLDADTKMLSGGEKSRLCIARALCLNSETYLIDEPTSALDVDTQIQVMKNIINYLQSKTIIIVTHSNKSASLCEHMFTMNKGEDIIWDR